MLELYYSSTSKLFNLENISSLEVVSSYVTIKTHIDGSIDETDFELKKLVLALSVEPGSHDIIIKNLFVSVNPYQLNRMKSYSSSQKSVSAAVRINPGEEIGAYGVRRVLVSGHLEFKKGDLVAGFITWGEYSRINNNGGSINKLDPMGFPLSYHVGILAYGGFFKICNPKKGDKVFVSATSGSVGNLVGQYAKLFGCYVVRCAESKKKVELLKEKLGFDDAFNYKEEPDLKSALKRYVTIKTHIDGSPEESDFELRKSIISLSIESGSGDIIVKNLFVSVDPYQLNRMKSYSSSQTASSFAVGISPGEEINTYVVGRVLVSGNAEFENGDLVAGLITWGEYSRVSTGNRMIRKLDPMGFPLSYHVGILGFSGLTAYGGFFETCNPKKWDKVFVSAASASVGNLVGQYAKLFGCYVVGCAGSKKKVELLKEELGFDDAFSYKEYPDLKSALKRYFPEGIDIYFDNVGGEMLEAAVSNMNQFGRVAVCGVISEYTDPTKRAAPNMIDIIYKRIKIQGFLASDHMNVYSDFISTTVDHLRTGKIHVLEDVSHGVESIPSALIALFKGYNVGKTVVQIAQE